MLIAIQAANDGHAAAYGADPWTARAQEVPKRHFGPRSESLLVFNGSDANVVCLRLACRPWEAAICVAGAHVNVGDEHAVQASVLLWRRSAAHANAMATRLAERLRHVSAITITQRVQANAWSAILPPAPLTRRGRTGPSTPGTRASAEVRLMCSWDTTAEEVDAFADALTQSCRDELPFEQ